MSLFDQGITEPNIVKEKLVVVLVCQCREKGRVLYCLRFLHRFRLLQVEVMSVLTSSLAARVAPLTRACRYSSTLSEAGSRKSVNNDKQDPLVQRKVIFSGIQPTGIPHVSTEYLQHTNSGGTHSFHSWATISVPYVLG